MLAPLLPRKPSAVQVSFQFEEAQSHIPSVIETAARNAHSAIINSGSDADQFAFFHASKAADWFCGIGMTPATESNQVSTDAKGHRLRAIKYGSKTLLECSYGSDGRLTRADYFNGETVFYERDDANRTRTTRISSGRQVVVKARTDDLIESITYDNGASFGISTMTTTTSPVSRFQMA